MQRHLLKIFTNFVHYITGSIIMTHFSVLESSSSACAVYVRSRKILWNICYHTVHIPESYGLEDQHMEWKPAGQPEHASLNQCQLIVANRCSGHPQQVVEIRFLCNVIDAGALIGPCSHVTSCCCLIC